MFLCTALATRLDEQQEHLVSGIFEAHKKHSQSRCWMQRSCKATVVVHGFSWPFFCFDTGVHCWFLNITVAIGHLHGIQWTMKKLSWSYCVWVGVTDCFHHLTQTISEGWYAHLPRLSILSGKIIPLPLCVVHRSLLIREESKQICYLRKSADFANLSWQATTYVTKSFFHSLSHLSLIQLFNLQMNVYSFFITRCHFIYYKVISVSIQ